jgi:abequosyltransferase
MILQPLLSICIPTYNRANTLEKTLKNIINDKDYNNKLIEIIVSDNFSTDNTYDVVNKFSNIIYHKNSSIISAGENVVKSLEYGTGKYLKLYNDTIILKEGTIRFLLDKIIHSEEEENLIFSNNNFVNSNCQITTHDKESFLKQMSFSTTWILNFGIWNQDFKKITNKTEFAELQFPHVDIFYKMLNFNKKTLIYFNHFVDVYSIDKKGGYNIFDTFINNYLFIIKKQKISTINYEIEKYRLFRYFVYPWLVNLLPKNNVKYTFDTKDSIAIIFKKYYYNLYIYPFILLYFIKKFL